MRTIAVYAGSFDPFTNGHLNIVQKAAKLFDVVYILITVNQKKKKTFSSSKMRAAIQKTFDDLNLTNCYVLLNNTTSHVVYTVDIADTLGAQYLVRGLRGDEEEFVYEEQIASFNKDRNSKIETIYIRGDDNTISSTFIRTCFMANRMEEIKENVPQPVYEFLKGETDGK